MDGRADGRSGGRTGGSIGHIDGGRTGGSYPQLSAYALLSALTQLTHVGLARTSAYQ